MGNIFADILQLYWKWCHSPAGQQYELKPGCLCQEMVNA